MLSRFYSFSQNTSLAGLARATSTHRKTRYRIAWSLILLVVSAIFLWTFVHSLVKYFRYETVTSVRKLWHKSLELPQITICSNGYLDKTRIQEKYPELAKFLEVDYPTSDMFNAVSLIQGQLRTPLMEILQDGMVRVEDMFESCSIHGHEYPCSTIMSYVTTDLNICYTFDPRKSDVNTTLSVPGPDFGIAFDLSIEGNKYLLSSSPGVGVTLLTHDPDLTWPLMKQRAVALAPGFEHFIAIQRSETKRMSEPYNIRCSSNKNYSYEKCLGQCHIAALYDPCGCSFHGKLHNITGKRACTLYDMITCFLNHSTTHEVKACACHPSCLEINYATDVSSLYLPTQASNSPDAAAENTSKSLVPHTKMGVKVFYKSMEVMITQEKAAMDWRQILAEIGGLIGLFLGASIITLCEIGEVICLMIYSGVKPSKSSNRRQSTQLEQEELNV